MLLAITYDYFVLRVKQEEYRSYYGVLLTVIKLHKNYILKLLQQHIGDLQKKKISFRFPQYWLSLCLLNSPNHHAFRQVNEMFKFMFSDQIGNLYFKVLKLNSSLTIIC